MSSNTAPKKRGGQDVVGFRRIFILFCALVVLPSVLLSGFGIVAIRNEGQAERERLRERSKIILNQMESRFVALLSDAIREVESIESPSEVPPNILEEKLQRLNPIVGLIFYSAPSRKTELLWPKTQPNKIIAADIEAELAALTLALPNGKIHHQITKSLPSLGLATFVVRNPGDVMIFFLREQSLQYALEDLLGDADSLKLSLSGPTLSNQSKDGPVEKVMQELLPEQAKSFFPADEILSRRLVPPFDSYRLQIIAIEQKNPVALLYGILLVLFNLALLIGVILTSRLIWKETRLSLLKTDFVSHVSHELRTPLTSIRMFIETLRLGRATTPQDQEECLELLSQETERLSQMIERVLGYARLKSGRRIFNFTKTHIGDLVEDALQAFRAHTLTHDPDLLEITVHIEKDLPALDLDRDAMGEALLNILGNAYKYSGTNKKIMITVERQRKKIHLTLQDNGPGIPRKDLKRIFDRFYQSDGLLSRPTQGSGLGLAITKSIIEGHRGKIRAENRVQGGCAFVITLQAP
jgi:two-component system, OmpR family, phosphate regulon sensor histidine kinase PhoR